MVGKIFKSGWLWFAVLSAAVLLGGGRFLPQSFEGYFKKPGRNYMLASNTVSAAIPQEVVNLQEAFSAVAELAKEAVVSISTVQIKSFEYYNPYEFFFGDPLEEFFGRPRRDRPQPKQMERRYEGMGSGVVIDSKGLVLTNEHVVRGADEIKIHIANRSKPLTGEVVGKDARTDLAVVRIKEKGNYHSLAMADSSKIKVGDWAIAIGSPFGLEHTVTVGVISAVRQSLNIEGQNYRDLIQTDAAINRGNSGGPLLNIRGEVIGINTAIYAPTGVFSGIGFAIPSNRAKDILGDLIHKGKVVRGWLGVEIKNVDEIIAGQFGLKEAKGALINDVFGNSPADKAGLKRGDIIMQFDGRDIADVLALQDAVALTQPKKKVKLKVLRNKQEITVDLTTGEMPQEGKEQEPAPKEADELSKEWLGMKASAVSPAYARRYNLSAKDTGVVIVELDKSKEAAQSGLTEGDLIKSINQTEITGVESFNKVAKTVDISKGVIFDIIRDGKPLYISFILEK